MRRIVVPLLLLTAVPAAAGEWKEDDPANRQVIDVEPETLRGVLAMTGAKETAAPDMQPGTIAATFPNGSHVLISLERCDSAGRKCGGLMLWSFFEPPPGWDRARIKEALLAHSASYHFGTLSLVDDKERTMMMLRSVNADFGMLRGQLFLELVDFAMSVEQFEQALKAGTPRSEPAGR
jgi:hypothetical protein